jgi:hypothetical protein
VRRAATLTAVVLAIAGSLPAQTGSRRLATIDALRQFPGFFHLQNILLRGEFAEAGNSRILLRADTDEIRVELADGARTTTGVVEVRGQLIDVGRLEPDDPRSGPIRQPNVEQPWPKPGEELFLRVTDVTAAQPLTTPSVRGLALEPWKFEGQKVTLVGNFRGRNLFGDLPGAPASSRYDFVLRSADAAVWVTGLRPRGRGFDLDVDRRMDSGQWVEVSGTVTRSRGLVRIDATGIALAKAPASEPVPVEVAAAPPPKEPSEVVFSAPTNEETDVSPGAPIRVQFSRGLREPSIASRFRLTYVGDTTPIPFKLTYNAAARAVEIRPAAPLERLRTVRLEIVEGAEAFDGAPVLPWAMTFSTGG